MIDKDKIRNLQEQVRTARDARDVANGAYLNAEYELRKASAVYSPELTEKHKGYAYIRRRGNALTYLVFKHAEEVARVWIDGTPNFSHRLVFTAYQFQIDRDIRYGGYPTALTRALDKSEFIADKVPDGYRKISVSAAFRGIDRHVKALWRNPNNK